jgi:hypothetical protein
MNRGCLTYFTFKTQLTVEDVSVHVEGL